MDISIIICTRDHASSLRETLSSLSEITYLSSNACELILVDNASATDETARAAQREIPGLVVRYVREERVGLDNARNAGLRAAKGEILVFTDDDVRPRPDWLVRLTEPLSSGGARAAVGGVDLPSDRIRPWMEMSHRSSLADSERLQNEVVGPGRESVSELIGANMAFHRSVLEKVPYFDPELDAGASGFAGDTLFAWQLRETGIRIAPAFDARVEHHFDAGRVQPQHWRGMAQRLGRSFGYIDYHWRHQAVPAPRLRLIKRSLRLAHSRRVRRREWPHEEGLPEWEMSLRREIAYLRYYVQAGSSPRNYALRGLRKIRGVLP